MISNGFNIWKFKIDNRVVSKKEKTSNAFNIGKFKIDKRFVIKKKMISNTFNIWKFKIDKGSIIIEKTMFNSLNIEKIKVDDGVVIMKKIMPNAFNIGKIELFNKHIKTIPSNVCYFLVSNNTRLNSSCNIFLGGWPALRQKPKKQKMPEIFRALMV